MASNIISEEEEVWPSYITMAASLHVSVTNAASALTSMAVEDASIQGKTSPQSELLVETVISYEEESANDSDSDTQPKQQAGRKRQNQCLVPLLVMTKLSNLSLNLDQQ